MSENEQPNETPAAVEQTQATKFDEFGQIVREEPKENIGQLRDQLANVGPVDESNEPDEPESDPRDALTALRERLQNATPVTAEDILNKTPQEN